MKLEVCEPLSHPPAGVPGRLSFEWSQIKIVRFNFRFHEWGTSVAKPPKSFLSVKRGGIPP